MPNKPTRLDLFIKANLSFFLKDLLLCESEKKELFSLPRLFWQNEIKIENILFKQKKAKPSSNINDSEKLFINFNWKKIKKNWNVFYRKKLLPYPIKINFLKSDRNVAMLNKPIGISVHPSFPLSKNLSRRVSLIEGVSVYFPEILKITTKNNEKERPGIVHRLDKETSGVMLVAKNNKSENFLKRQFKKREIEKRYLALVKGIFPYKKFQISGLMGKKSNNPIFMGTNNLKIMGLAEEIHTYPHYPKKTKILNPKKSVTTGEKIASGTLDKIKKHCPETQRAVFLQWKELLGASKKISKDTIFSLLEIHPLTGRTHQIRVHLSDLGFPIVGDKLYGSKNTRIIPLHCLHSFKIKWFNPDKKVFLAESAKIILS